MGPFLNADLTCLPLLLSVPSAGGGELAAGEVSIAPCIIFKLVFAWTLSPNTAWMAGEVPSLKKA